MYIFVKRIGSTCSERKKKEKKCEAVSIILTEKLGHNLERKTEIHFQMYLNVNVIQV